MLCLIIQCKASFKKMPKNSNRIFLSSAKTEAKLCLQGLQYFPDVQICLWLITTEYAKYVGIYYETSIISDSCHLGYMALCVLMEAEFFLSTEAHELMISSCCLHQLPCSTCISKKPCNATESVYSTL